LTSVLIPFCDISNKSKTIILISQKNSKCQPCNISRALAMPELLIVQAYSLCDWTKTITRNSQSILIDIYIVT